MGVQLGGKVSWAGARGLRLLRELPGGSGRLSPCPSWPRMDLFFAPKVVRPRVLLPSGRCPLSCPGVVSLGFDADGSGSARSQQLLPTAALAAARGLLATFAR